MRDSKTATLLLAHGSSDANWLAPFSDLLANIRKGLQGERVELSYMELAEPSMEGQIIKLAEEGFGHIDIMPLFFAAGRHLRTLISYLFFIRVANKMLFSVKKPAKSPF